MDKQREEFEAWWKDQHVTIEDTDVDIAWTAWQAAQQINVNKSDAEEWGNALNEASWELIHSYQRNINELHPPGFFNNSKTILRDAILAYFKALEK